MDILTGIFMGVALILACYAIIFMTIFIKKMAAFHAKMMVQEEAIIAALKEETEKLQSDDTN